MIHLYRNETFRLKNGHSASSRTLIKHAKDLDARDPRNTVYAEMMPYGIGKQYISMVVGRFGEFSKDFIKLRDYIARQRAYAYNGHFNSSVNRAMSMFKLSITPRWALMAWLGEAYPRPPPRLDQRSP